MGLVYTWACELQAVSPWAILALKFILMLYLMVCII